MVYRHEAARALLWAIAALGGLAIVLPLASLVLGTSRASALALLGIGGLAAMLVVIGGIVMGLIAPRRRFGSDRDLARWVGSRHAPIASDLLSSVELANAPKRPGAPSPELVDALIESTESELGTIEPASLLPARDVPKARRYALAAALLNVGLLALVPAMMFAGWKRLVLAQPSPYDGAQLSALPLVGDLRATLTFPAYSKRKQADYQSSSGDLRGLPGTKVTLSARMLVPAAAVELVIESGSPEATKKIPAKLTGDQVTAELTIEASSQYRVAVVMPTGERKIEQTPRAIEAEPDQAPAVQLMAPADALDVANLRRVELAYVIEDDFGVTSAELVWEGGKDRGRKAIALDSAHGRVQGKLMWDIADVQVPSGGNVRYWIEAKDNDNVGGPNVGKSRELSLKVVSPRERHEETLDRQQEVAEKLLRNLGGRLVGFGDSLEAREDHSRQLRDAVLELSSISAAYDHDPHASDLMRKALRQMHERLDRWVTAEQKLLPKGAAKVPAGRFAAIDPRLIAQLEDDVLVLADWLDRERLEGLLDISDEIAAHQKRLAELLAQYNRTNDPRLLDEIEREMRALDRSYAELEKHRRGMAEDVLDQYVHRDAVQAQQGTSCVAEVRSLVAAGRTVEAQQKLEQCQQQQAKGAGALEGSLASLRGDKFGDEQRKLDEVMNELADVAKDQDDIAAEANRIFEAYARKADDIAKEHQREASKKVSALVDKLRKRLGSVNESGLTPFAKEELDIVERRLNDVEHMVDDGDLAEALGMARQAKQSLDTIAGELEAAINDDPKSKWADATQDALEGVERAAPVAKELIDELASLSPKPEQIMSADDLKALERLRRRQAMNRQRTDKLGDRTKQMGADLPGDAAAELGKKLGTASQHMGKADDRMKGKDPSGSREAARAAADALAKARDRARNAARQAQEGTTNDEPIRIPGADEYRAPERFREELQEANKVKPPEGFEEMSKRYYQELIK
ncbi:MAG TPA: hypothetical protein VIV11_22760 [Kofleriaceae bacterium]